MKTKLVQFSMLCLAGLFCFSSANAQLMQNGGFETGAATLPEWDITGTGAASYTTAIINKADQPNDVQEGTYSLQYIVSSPVINDWDIQLRNRTCLIKKDSMYVFSFWAKASTDINGDPATMKIQVEDLAVGWPPHYRMGMTEGNDLIPIDTNWKKYSLVYIGLDNFDAINKIFMYSVRPMSQATYYVDNFQETEITDLGPTMKTDIDATGDTIHLTVPSSITDPSANQDFITVTADGVKIPVVSTDWSATQGHLVIDIALSSSIKNSNKVVLSYDKLGFLQFNFSTVVSLPSFSVNVKGGTTAVEKVSDTFTSVYPSVVHDQMFVKSSNVISNIILRNVSGQEVKNVKIGASNTSINVNSLAQGVYFVNVIAVDNSSKVFKIVKK